MTLAGGRRVVGVGVSITFAHHGIARCRLRPGPPRRGTSSTARAWSPAPDVPPFRLEGLETRDPRRVGADEGDTVNSRDFEDGATLFPDRIFTHEKKKKNVSLEDAKRAIPKVLAGWNVTFSPSSPGTSASRTSATRAREPTTS